MGELLYQKQNWENLPSEETPIDAEHLLHMEDGIFQNSLQLSALSEQLSSFQSFQVITVEELPKTEIQTNVLYLLQKSDGQTLANNYDAYVNIDGTPEGWECLEDTGVDLSQYVTEEMLESKGFLTAIPRASTEQIGGVKPDGTSIEIDDDGTIHAKTAGSGNDGNLKESWEEILAEKDYNETVYPVISFGRAEETEESPVGIGSIAWGMNQNTKAAGAGSIAIGSASQAKAFEAIAVHGGTAEGERSLAIGNGAVASGQNCIAINGNASGNDCIAIWGKASGMNSVAIGKNVECTGSNSMAVGNGTIVKGYNSFAEGYATTAVGGAMAGAHAEGGETNANGEGAHAEGYGTTASAYCHAEGYETTASGSYCHAEGYGTAAVGYYSHAEGCRSKANGQYSHAEGYESFANEMYSHAQGYQTTASHLASTSMGYGTKTTGVHQLVAGRYNAETAGPLFIIGNGNSDKDRKNAFAVYPDGSLTAGSMRLETYLNAQNLIIQNASGSSQPYSYSLLTIGRQLDSILQGNSSNLVYKNNLPLAGYENAGCVIPDGTSITIDENGKISTSVQSGVILTGTLMAGETQITFTNDAINEESMIDIYTNTYGVNPTMVDYVQETATLTLTFDAQEMDLGVKVRVM